MEAEKSAVAAIKEARDKSEDYKFLDVKIERAGERLDLRIFAQIDPKHDPDRKKNYDNWDLTPQEEAERWLNREILVNEKIRKFSAGADFSADEIVDANREPKAGAMFLLKRTGEQARVVGMYGEAEGRALAKTLLDMQSGLDATGMIKEIMEENGIETKLEMERKIFEDYFDHFDGYMDNSKVILEELGDEELAERIEGRMEQHREAIESRQLGEDEYSLVHGNVNFDTVKYSKDGRVSLSDWQLAGKTQNKGLSLVYDLGNVFQEAVEKFDDLRKAGQFIGGIEAEIRARYQDSPDMAEAIISLAKLRSFAMILNGLDGEKKDFVLKSIGE